jgi:hypothetical protein
MARSRPVRFPDQELSEPYRGDRSEVSAAMTVFLGAIVALAAFIWFGASADMRASLLLTAVLGGVTGWGAGILLTPYKSEEGGPSDLQKILLAGLIGYLIAKFNTLGDLISGLGTGGSVAPVLAHAAVALILFISAMGLTYVHRTYKMSRPAREAVILARMVRSQKPEKRETAPRRPIAVPRLPLEGLTSKVSEAAKAERQSQS